MIPNDGANLSRLDPVLAKYAGGNRTALLPALHDTQRIYGYLPAPALKTWPTRIKPNGGAGYNAMPRQVETYGNSR